MVDALTVVLRWETIEVQIITFGLARMISLLCEGGWLHLSRLLAVGGHVYTWE
jgi:hypothetical protein